MKPLSDSEYRALSQHLLRDLVLDTGGNVLLVMGLWLAFADGARHFPAWLHSPPAMALMIATGLINLRLIPPRLRRLQDWQTERARRRDGG